MPVEVVAVVDCGSTNITASAVDARGEILASESAPNSPVSQPDGPDGALVWDAGELRRKVLSCLAGVVEAVGAGSVRAITAVTWGADGAPVDSSGSLTYPPISWQCPRTGEISGEISSRLGARRLFEVTGYQVMSINTLFKLAWLRRNAPAALDSADKWLMMPGLVTLWLSGEQTLDRTSASTMMALDLSQESWPPELLAEAGLTEDFFPPLVSPGEVVGEVAGGAAEATGLPAGTPVVAGGHDTQFALLGSGAGPDEAVLSTGTWEVLMARTPDFRPSEAAFEEGLIWELDAEPGLFDPQLLMMGSGVLEWVRENMYPEVADRTEAYSRMIDHARAAGPGAGGVTFVPSFVPDAAPTGRYGTQGTILGLGLETGRGHVYRAALEGLSFQLRRALEVLEMTIGLSPAGVRVVGGGARNELWNQLRADVTGLPIAVPARPEATTLGAAAAAWVGAGKFASLEEGRRALAPEARTVEPSGERQHYTRLYENYASLPAALEDFYRG